MQLRKVWTSKTHNNYQNPERPAPAFRLCTEASRDGTNNRTKEWTYRPERHRSPTFLWMNYVCDSTTAKSKRSSTCRSGKEAEYKEHADIGANSTSNCEGKEYDAGCMVDRQASIQLRQWG